MLDREMVCSARGMVRGCVLIVRPSKAIALTTWADKRLSSLGEPYNIAFLRGPATRQCSLRLVAQDVALSRRKQGFESPRERQINQMVKYIFARRLIVCTDIVRTKQDGTDKLKR